MCFVFVFHASAQLFLLVMKLLLIRLFLPLLLLLFTNHNCIILYIKLFFYLSIDCIISRLGMSNYTNTLPKIPSAYPDIFQFTTHFRLNFRRSNDPWSLPGTLWGQLGRCLRRALAIRWQDVGLTDSKNSIQANIGFTINYKIVVLP